MPIPDLQQLLHSVEPNLDFCEHVRPVRRRQSAVRTLLLVQP